MQLKHKLLFIGLFLAFDADAQSFGFTDSLVGGDTTWFIYKKQNAVPDFDAGYSLGDYLAKNLHYPETAKRNNTKGRVEIKFTVRQDGSIADCRIIRSIGNGCDEEGVRLVKNMPKWKPRPKKAEYTLPVKFDFGLNIREVGPVSY